MKRGAGYIATGLGVSPRLMMMAVSRHWSVESSHWELDMTFHEDARYIGERNAPEGLSGVRKPALDFLAPLRARREASFKRRAESLPRDRSCLEEALEKDIDEVTPPNRWRIHHYMQ